MTVSAQVAATPDAPAATAGQSAPARDTVVEDIVVTARKQGETLLRTPATVTVLQAEDIAAANITNINQLSGVIPGLVMMQGTAGSSVAMRGLGSTSADPSMESSVATFIDGIYMGHPRDFTLPMYDVAQVELVKGTQSTLLGKNTSLGAISITSRMPGDVFAFNGTAMYNTGIDGYQVQAGMDAPLGGGYAVRVAGFFNDEQGWVRNAYVGRDERQVREWSGRAILEGPLGDGGTLRAIYQHEDRRGRGHYFEILSDPNAVVTRRARALGQTDFEATGNDRSYSGADAPAGGQAGPLQFDDQNGDRASVVATFDLGGVDLTSQTSWFGWQSQRATDFDFTRAQLLDLYDTERNRALSQELRVASAAGSRLSWLAGVFLYDNDWRLRRAAKAQAGGGVFAFGGTTDGSLRIDTQAASGFGSVRYALSEPLTISAGLRYTIEAKTPTYERVSTGFFALPSQSPSIVRTELDGVTERNLDGDIGIQYRPGTRTMVYATMSKGSKSGGFQSGPTTLGAARYSGETAYTAEVGAKIGFPGSGYLTAALFQSWVDDFQVSRVEVVDGFAQSVISNGDVGARGFEAGGAWHPFAGFTLEANIVYSDARFRKAFTGNGTVVAYKDMPLPRAPRFTGRIASKYERAVTDDLDVRLGASVDYSSASDLQFRSTDPRAPTSERRALLDAQIGVGSHAGGWELAVVGTNLTDRRFVAFTTPGTAAPGAYYGSRNRPRVISLQLSIRQ